MSILPTTDIESTINRLLPWIQKNPLGKEEKAITDCEKRLGHKLPESLRKLYLLAGKDEKLMQSFNSFAKLDELTIRDNKLIFIEESQGVCWWGAELGEENPFVYIQVSEEEEWIAEDARLEEFLALMIYNQCIQMGYEHCGIIGMSGDDLYEVLDAEWEKVVDYSGLHVYWQKGALIWSIEFSEDEDIENDIYFSTPYEEIYYLNEIRYKLAEI